MTDFIASIDRTDERIPYEVVTKTVNGVNEYEVHDALGNYHCTFSRKTCGTDVDARSMAYGMVDALNNEPYAD